MQNQARPTSMFTSSALEGRDFAITTSCGESKWLVETSDCVLTDVDCLSLTARAATALSMTVWMSGTADRTYPNTIVKISGKIMNLTA
jgi:hypothetical protein